MIHVIVKWLNKTTQNKDISAKILRCKDYKDTRIENKLKKIKTEPMSKENFSKTYKNCNNRKKYLLIIDLKKVKVQISIKYRGELFAFCLL